MQNLEKYVHYVFLIGIFTAILSGGWLTLLNGQSCSAPSIVREYILTSFLVLFGTVVGIFNITSKEFKPFLISVIALISAGFVELTAIPFLGHCLQSSVRYLVMFIAPSALVVALKAAYKVTRS